MWFVDARSSDERLSFGERTVLYTLGGAGFLIWIALALLIVAQQARPAGADGMAEPLIRRYDTRTPTSAARVTATALPSATATFTLLPIPTATVTLAPTPMASGVSMVPIDEDIEVIALLGIDESQDAVVWRTDSIILAFVDRKNAHLVLLSVPRDLWVQIPGHGSNRINTVDALGERSKYPGGGVALFDETLRYNLGLWIDHYVRIDFEGFVHIVDALGGIEVDVKEPITDNFPDPTVPSGWAWITLSRGPRHMDGRMALSYCRSRITTNDFDRSARQQQVLFALWQKALTLENIGRAPKLWTEFRGYFETDLNVAEAVSLAYFLHELEPDEVRTKHLNFRLTRSWTTTQGAQVLLPRTKEIQAVVLDLHTWSE
jgi:LCP family protein required for cell wall assembly